MDPWGRGVERNSGAVDLAKERFTHFKKRFGKKDNVKKGSRQTRDMLGCPSTDIIGLDVLEQTNDFFIIRKESRFWEMPILE